MKLNFSYFIILIIFFIDNFLSLDAPGRLNNLYPIDYYYGSRYLGKQINLNQHLICLHHI